MESLFPHYFHWTTKWNVNVPEIFGHLRAVSLVFGCFKVDFLGAHVSWEFRLYTEKLPESVFFHLMQESAPYLNSRSRYPGFTIDVWRRNSLSEGLQGRFKNATDLTEAWEGAKSGTRNCLGVPKRLFATI